MAGESRPTTAEEQRLAEARARTAHWKRWGPYLAERQWGTVREDYSPHGTAWDYFPHDHARSRAYRWGEDGLLGISDNHQRLCLALALWNERDPILKERLFGLTGPEGNHGEDVKECYFYLDATPTHSYLKGLYKYPQGEYPYAQLVEENRRRGRGAPEFELLDTGVFDQDRYFDVFAEYAKASPNDVLVRITVENRGPDAAPLHVLPTLWFRNTWSWDHGVAKPRLAPTPAPPGAVSIRVARPPSSSPTTRPTSGAASATAGANPARRTRSTRRSCGAARSSWRPAGRARRRPPTTGWRSRPGVAQCSGCDWSTALSPLRSGRSSTGSSPSASGRRTSSTGR